MWALNVAVLRASRHQIRVLPFILLYRCVGPLGEVYGLLSGRRLEHLRAEPRGLGLGVKRLAEAGKLLGVLKYRAAWAAVSQHLVSPDCLWLSSRNRKLALAASVELLLSVEALIIVYR